jgi:type IV pilus assembly protein PilO
MAKIDELSLPAKLGILFGLGLVAGVGFYFYSMAPLYEEIKQLQVKVADKKAENARLREFEPKLAELNKQIAQLENQLVEAKKIVPDEKDADQFIKLLHDTASIAGIEIRRYTAMPVSNQQYYSEVPFQIDIDGPYYSVLNFFDRMAKVERIVNIGNLQVSNLKNTSAAKVKTTYSYAPGETVVASCTASTFFSHDLMPPDVPKPGSAKP